MGQTGGGRSIQGPAKNRALETEIAALEGLPRAGSQDRLAAGCVVPSRQPVQYQRYDFCTILGRWEPQDLACRAIRLG